MMISSKVNLTNLLMLRMNEDKDGECARHSRIGGYYESSFCLSATISLDLFIGNWLITTILFGEGISYILRLYYVFI